MPRNYFHREIGVGTIKCLVEYYYYSHKEGSINNNLCSNKCLRCSHEAD